MEHSPDSPTWVDAQPFLRRVCDGMAVGELLHTPAFSLFQSMTAIEIGDPKMDIGLRKGRQDGANTSEPDDPDALIAAGRAPLALPPRSLAALMDRLLCMEVAWHAGGLLPTTVFSSLYMLRTMRLKESPALHAYCLGVRASCTAACDAVVGGQVCEEEDLCVHAFNIRLDPPGQEAMTAAAAALRGAEAAVSRGDTGGGDCSAALLARLRFRRLVIEIFQRLADPSEMGVETAAALCLKAYAELERIAETAGPEEEETEQGGDLSYTALGFVPEINRKHMGMAPPRTSTPLPLRKAVAWWSSALKLLAGTCTSLLAVKGDWQELKRVVGRLAGGAAPALVRSLVHIQLAKPLAARGRQILFVSFSSCVHLVLCPTHMPTVDISDTKPPTV
jgi:hypothetical protein